jgi:hypothetical protein
VRLPRIILTTLLGTLPLLGLGLPAQAGSTIIAVAGGQLYGGHSYSTQYRYGNDSSYRLRPGFALSYGVAGTNTGNSRYFEAPRSHTYGSVPPRLGHGRYDFSTRQRHHDQSHGHPRNHYHHDDRYQRGYQHGYHDGRRHGQSTPRHQLGR